MPEAASRGGLTTNQRGMASSLTGTGITAAPGVFDIGTSKAPAQPAAAPQTPTAPETTNPASTNTAQQLLADFPWLQQIGLDAAFLQEMVASSSGEAEMVSKIRQSTPYKQRFPGLYRGDGSMRMNEAQYLSRESEFATLALRYGWGDRFDISKPSSFVGVFDSEQDPNEFESRLKTYRQLQESGQNTIDAFYVYAGLNVTTDDLFNATIDPAARQNLSDTYNQAVAKSPFDYTTWISRATEVGLNRVADTLNTLKANGAVTGAAVQTVMRTDPNFARQIMDALYHGAGTGGGTLQLDELLSSFEYAAIGAAATNAGLSLPTKERIAQIRAAGIDRAAAAKAYGSYGASSTNYSEMVRRATGNEFKQGDFESAVFLGDSARQAALQTGLSREENAGKQVGTAGFNQDRRGRLNQQGLRGY